MAIIDQLLKEVVLKEGSDLHYVTGSKPMIRLNGQLMALRDQDIPLDEGTAILLEILNKTNRQRFETDMDIDFAYQVQGVSRFRVAMFHQSRGVGAVFRVIPDQPIPLEKLGLPPRRGKICRPRPGSGSDHRCYRFRKKHDDGCDYRYRQSKGKKTHHHD